MVKSKENGITLAPFLVKCYEIVDDECTNELISWAESNDSFIIWDESKFSSQLLPKYFKHSNFSSFVRQLNIYGFRKVDTDRWEFENPAFIRDQKHLLKNITRRKQLQSLVQRNSSQQKDEDPLLASDVDKRTALWKEVENLKTDKNVVTQELIKLRQQQETSQSKVLLLREQFKGIEKNQQQMLSFIVMAMQRPELFAQFLQPKENSWHVRKKGKNKLSDGSDDCESISSDGAIVRYQPAIEEYPVAACSTAHSESDDLMGLDFTSEEIKDLLMDVDFLLGPVDENLHSFENHGQFILPDVPENDTMLDQLLFSSPTEHQQYPELHTEACTETKTQIRSDCNRKNLPSSSCMNIEPDESNYLLNLADDTSEKVEALSEQMGYLSS